MQLSDFKFMLTSVADGDINKMPELAMETLEMLAELSKPREIRNGEAQLAARRSKVTAFASKWAVKPAWISDVLDAFDELSDSDHSEAHAWLSRLAEPVVPEPRADDESKLNMT
ncbi:MAG: hypothetical protein ABIS59_01785 [Candidatus Saccharibacteria bacterium]